MGHLLTVLQKKKIIVQDGFNRADNAASMGNANTGQLWVALAGTAGILGNKAYFPVVTGLNNTAVVVDSGISDGYVQVTFANLALSNNRLLSRYTDVDNGIMLQPQAGQYVLYRREAGTFVSIGSYATSPVSGDVIRAVLVGSSIKIHINGVERISVTSTFNQSAKKHGIGVFDSTTVTFEDFSVGVVS